MGLLNSCAKEEITDFNLNKIDHDSAQITYTFKKGKRTVTPPEEVVIIEIPSEGTYFPGYIKNNILTLPDEEVGNNVEMKVKVCGIFKKENWVCDSLSLRSSKKTLTAASTANFSNLNNPYISIVPVLSREKFGNHNYGDKYEVIEKIDRPSGLVNIYLNSSSETHQLYDEKKGLFGVWSFSESDLKKLSLAMKEHYMNDDHLQISYNSIMSWKNLTYTAPLNSQYIGRPSLIEMKDNFYHQPTISPLEAKYYSFYNYGSKLGVVTFKEFLATPYLKVEVYSDSNFSNLMASSEESNVLFDAFSNEYIYIKVSNTGRSYDGQYKLNTHMVDYISIAADAAADRVLLELAAWVLDTDTNSLSRLLDVFNSIVNTESLDQATERYLYSELKRQLSKAAGGNFASDVGASALPDIGRAIYKYY